MPMQINTPLGREHPSFAHALPASDAELLALIAERADLIGRAPDGRVFLLVDLDGPTFERLSMAGADTEDLEDEPDDDDQAEP